MWERIIQSPIIDVLDILIVALVLYRLLAFVRDTRAVQMFVGLGLLMILSFIASSLGMIVVNRIIGTLQTVWVVAFIILFQPELRAALADLGMRRGLRMLREDEEIPAEREIIQAVERLSRRGLGALIVLEREIRLGRWIKTGTSLNADISAATLESIFTVPGPLHDGAAIIGQGKILAASCILPITERELLGYVFGTRHRAAIGLSEVSDAIIIVVSEESRAISLAYLGDIKRGLSIDDLTAEINRIAFTRGHKPEKSETAPA
jgi:diadenylate cyclase